MILSFYILFILYIYCQKVCEIRFALNLCRQVLSWREMCPRDPVPLAQALLQTWMKTKKETLNEGQSVIHSLFTTFSQHSNNYMESYGLYTPKEAQESYVKFKLKSEMY